MVTLPQHVFDYLKANSRSIPRDVISIWKLITQQGWNVSADQVTESLKQIDNQ